MNLAYAAGIASPCATSAWKRPHDESSGEPGDLAARDLGSVGDQRLELLLADQGRDDVRRLFAPLGCLEETKRAEDAVTGLDQVEAGKALHAFALRLLLRNAGAPNLP